MANSMVDALKNSMTKNKTDNKDNEFGEN